MTDTGASDAGSAYLFSTGDMWTASYTIVAGTIDDLNVIVTATDGAGNATSTFGFGGISAGIGGSYHITYGGGSYTVWADTGVVNIASDLSAGGAAVNLSVASGASVSISTSQHLSNLTLAANATLSLAEGGTPKVLALKSLTVDPTAVLDLTTNDLVLDYTGTSSPLTTVEAMVRAGYSGGTWRGNGITSSTAANNPGLYTVAILDNATRPTPFGTFDGVDTSSHQQVLVKFTWVADIDLDGLVTSNDAIAFAANYSDGAAANHQMGDLNYNGVFDANDAILFATAYNESLPQINTVTFAASPAPHRHPCH